MLKVTSPAGAFQAQFAGCDTHARACAALASAVEEQYATTRDISERATGAARGADDAAAGVGIMADSTAQAGDSSRRLLETSNQVNEATRILTAEAETFFKNLAAA